MLSASAPTAVTLSYDPTGRLNQTVASSTTTQYLYDGTRLSAELNSTGAILRRYVHGGGTDEPLVWYEGSGRYHAPLAAPRRPGLSDRLRATAPATSPPHRYMPTAPTASPTAPPGPSSRFLYTGQIEIPEAQLYYYKARVVRSGTEGGSCRPTRSDMPMMSTYTLTISEDPLDRGDPAEALCRSPHRASKGAVDQRRARVTGRRPWKGWRRGGLQGRMRLVDMEQVLHGRRTRPLGSL